MKSKAILLAAALAIVLPFGVANAKDNEQELETGNSQQVTETEVGTDQVSEQKLEAVKQRVEQAREAAKEKVEQAKAGAEERKIAVKQDRCETRKTKLTERIPQLTHSTTTIMGVLDAKYEKVKAIYASGKLTVSNYDALNTDVSTKQAAAQSAIASAKLTNVTIDCNDNTLGVQLDSFRSSVNATKTALKEYHTALVNLISALKASADKIESEAQGTTSNTTTNATTEGTN